MDSVYLHLPSNASPDIYPNNTSSTFTIHLAKNIHLEGRWEAGLVELQYVDSIINVREGENFLKIRFETTGLSPHDVHIQIRPGYYGEESALIEAINKAIKAELPALPFYLTVNEGGHVSTQKYTVGRKIGGKSMHATSIILAPHIQRQLGFEGLNLPLNTEHTALYPVDVSAGKPSQIFVYCDKIAAGFVGHTMAPLLRTVPVPRDRFGSTVTHTLERALYFPLSSLSFDTIEINLRDSVGRPIPFSYGTACALLELRRVG